MSSFLSEFVSTMGYLRLVTISDLVDIAILTFLFYKVIGLFRRTNAAKVARAVLFIVVAMWLAYQFNLHALNFLLSRAVELGFLALVIIFQPEIRRFLERIGSNNVLRLRRFFRTQTPASDLEQAIDETVEAYAEMSKNRVGGPDGVRAGDRPEQHHLLGHPLPVHGDQRAAEEHLLPKAPPPRRGGGGPGREDRRGSLHASHVRADEPEQGAGHAPPGGHRHERAVRRGGSHRLRGDGGHLHRGQRQPAPAPLPGDLGAHPAQ